MSEQLFAVSVAKATVFDLNDNLLFKGDNLLDSSLKTAVSMVDIRGGYGNAKLMSFFHSSSLEATITNPEWSLNYLAATLGATLQTGASNVYIDESITLVGHSGTVAHSPLGVETTTSYGWVTLADGSFERVTFTGSTFTTVGGGATDVVCVKYVWLDPAAKSIVVPSSIVPKIVRVVLDCQLASNASASNIVGRIQVVIPRLQLNGVADLALKADGYSTTSLSGTALKFDTVVAGCLSQSEYCYINQVKTSANWYDTCIALAIVGGDIAVTHPSTSTVVVKAIFSDGTVSTPPVADLSFTSGTVGTATIGLHTGVLVSVATGTSLIHVTVTAKTSLDANASLTVS